MTKSFSDNPITPPSECQEQHCCTSCETRVIQLLQKESHEAREEYIVHNAGVSPFTLKDMVSRGILKTWNGKFETTCIYYDLVRRNNS